MPDRQASTTNSAVTRVPPVPAAAAVAHFEGRLALETDCWDVHDALVSPRAAP